MATVEQLCAQFPEFSAKEVSEFHAQFQAFDADGNGHITEEELGSVMRNLGENVDGARLKSLIREVDMDNNGTVELNEFFQIIRNMRSGNVSSDAGFAGVVSKVAVTRIQGHSGSHSYSEEEKESFVEHINDVLKNDPHVSSKLPLPVDDMSIFKAVGDGLLLCKLINDAVPGTIDERALNTKQPINAYKIAENHKLAVNSAKAIGCQVVNVGGTDLSAGTPHIVLGLIWQIVKIGLMRMINLANHPGLVRLLEDGETLESLLALPPDQILLRWMNYHLKNAGSNKRVNNFTSDIKDSEAYTIVLNQVAPKECNTSPLQISDPKARCAAMLSEADKIGCKKYIKPRDVTPKPNGKLNLAFVANLFNTRPGLEPVEDMPVIEIVETREERTYRNWINHFGMDPVCNYIYEDLRDGLLLLKVLDKISPGIVSWNKVNQKHPLSTFKKTENCQYALVLAKSLKFSLVGIQGKDISDGNKTLTLALVWQMMRFHCLNIIRDLGQGKDVKDSDVVQWANERVSGAGKSSSIRSFKDPSIKTGLFFIDMVAATEPRAVDYDLVNSGASEADALLNASYAISCARKAGAVCFLLPEDIAEVVAKQCLTFAGSILAVQPQK